MIDWEPEKKEDKPIEKPKETKPKTNAELKNEIEAEFGGISNIPINHKYWKL